MATNGHYPPNAAPTDYLKVKKLLKIGDTNLGKLDVEKFSIGSITFGMPYLGNSIALPEVSSGTPMPRCKPPNPTREYKDEQTAEEMLKKALEFVENCADDCDKYLNDFEEGKVRAYRNVASHLEMLIKEAKQNG